MSYMKNYMMDIEEFCDGYFFDGGIEIEIKEVAEDAGNFFGTTLAKDYAIVYIKKTLGKI